MLIVFGIICILLLALGMGIVIKGDYDSEDIGIFIAVASTGLLVAVIIASVILGAKVSQGRVIDQKIEMYEQENTKIETQISDMVKQYQDYETGIFTELSPESAITLVSLCPELKADTLVQKQIEVYLANNDTIKGLKEDAIDISIYRWWLYFGG